MPYTLPKDAIRAEGRKGRHAQRSDRHEKQRHGSGVTVTVKLVPVSSRGDVFAPKPELVGSIVIW